PAQLPGGQKGAILGVVQDVVGDDPLIAAHARLQRLKAFQQRQQPSVPPARMSPPASTSDGALACFFAHAAFPASSRDFIAKRSAYWDQGRTAHGRQKGSGPEWPTFAERRDERRADRFADRVVPSGAPGFGA